MLIIKRFNNPASQVLHDAQSENNDVDDEVDARSGQKPGVKMAKNTYISSIIKGVMTLKYKFSQHGFPPYLFPQEGPQRGTSLISAGLRDVLDLKGVRAFGISGSFFFYPGIGSRSCGLEG